MGLARRQSDHWRWSFSVFSKTRASGYGARGPRWSWLFGLFLVGIVVGSELQALENTSSVQAEPYSRELDALGAEAPRPMLPLSEQEALTGTRPRRTAPRSRRSPWRAAFFNLTSADLKDLRTGEGRLGSYNFVSFDYRLDYNQRLSLRPQFSLDGAGKDFRGEMQSEQWRLGDLYLQYSHHNLALIGGELGVAGSFRLYIPNSEISRRSGNITQLHARMFFTSDLPGPWYVTYHFYPKYYVQSQRSYLTEFGQIRGNRRAELEHKLEFSYRRFSNVGFSQSAGLKHQWHYSSPANSMEEMIREFVHLEASMVLYLEATSLRLGLSNEIPLQGQRTPDFRLFREEQMKFVATTYVGF